MGKRESFLGGWGKVVDQLADQYDAEQKFPPKKNCPSYQKDELCECGPWCVGYNKPEPVKRLPVFVYGTLRNGMGNYKRLLEGNTTREIPAVLHDAKMVDVGAFPGVIDASHGTVYGELMFLDESRYEELLANLDRLEGHPYMYVRTAATVHTNYVSPVSQTEIDAWVYIWNGGVDASNKIESGDWLKYVAGDWLKYVAERKPTFFQGWADVIDKLDKEEC